MRFMPGKPTGSPPSPRPSPGCRTWSPTYRRGCWLLSSAPPAPPARLPFPSRALPAPNPERAGPLGKGRPALAPRLSVESYNFVLDNEKVEALGIARIPAIAIMGTEKDYGIRMYGLPSG